MSFVDAHKSVKESTNYKELQESARRVYYHSGSHDGLSRLLLVVQDSSTKIESWRNSVGHRNDVFAAMELLDKIMPAVIELAQHQGCEIIILPVKEAYEKPKLIDKSIF